jgi:hypothetical protein
MCGRGARGRSSERLATAAAGGRRADTWARSSRASGRHEPTPEARRVKPHARARRSPVRATSGRPPRSRRRCVRLLAPGVVLADEVVREQGCEFAAPGGLLLGRVVPVRLCGGAALVIDAPTVRDVSSTWPSSEVGREQVVVPVSTGDGGVLVPIAARRYRVDRKWPPAPIRRLELHGYPPRRCALPRAASVWVHPGARRCTFVWIARRQDRTRPGRRPWPALRLYRTSPPSLE